MAWSSCSLSPPRWPTRMARVTLMNPRCLVLWTSACNLARGIDDFAIMPTGFGKSLIYQLFPRLAKAALTLENSMIIVVSPLISIMRDQVEQLKKLGFSSAAIGIGEKGFSIFPAATAPFPKSRASYFRFPRFNTSPLYYLRAWHRL